MFNRIESSFLKIKTAYECIYPDTFITWQSYPTLNTKVKSVNCFVVTSQEQLESR